MVTSQPEGRNRTPDTIQYWRKIIRECNIDPDNIENKIADRIEWKETIEERIKYIKYGKNK